MKPAQIRNYLKLLRTPEGREVRRIRASALARYYYCAIQSYFTICGIEIPKPTDKLHPINIGTEIHEAVANARSNSKYEDEFWNAIMPFVEELRKDGAVFSRKWEHNNIIEQDLDESYGWLGAAPDEIKVNADHTISLIEYKTKKNPYIDWVDLAPAIFQLEIYIWILEPILAIIGYRITEATIVFLDQKKRVLGEKQVAIDYKAIEHKIRDVLTELNKPPAEMVPPKRYKCLNCFEIYRSRCPYAN